MYKKILVALDIADREGVMKLVEKASAFAKFSGAEIHTVSIVPDFGTSMVGTFFSKDYQKEAMHNLGEEVQAFISQNFDDDLYVRPHVVIGSVYDEIMRAANELECDLIIIGAHRPELSDYLLGPNAARVVRHARASVLVVRD